MARILGLDLGTNSIGWAITEQIENGYRLVDKGVNIFQEGVNRTKSGEEPTGKIRTESRSSRRKIYRRRLRKINLLKVLLKYNMCPPLTQEQLDAWRYKKQYPMDEEFINWQRTDDKIDKNPYHARFIALTEKLDLSLLSNRYLLGRAFYHLSQRRGFLSNRKDSTPDDESGKVKTAINSLDKEIEATGCKYLGEFFYKLYCNKEKIRTSDGYGYTSREGHYLKEFNAICQKQQLPADVIKLLYDAIFFQNPLKSQKWSVGTCTFERGKSRCPVSHPRFEEFRMLSFVNNIKMQTPRDEMLRPLTYEEKLLVFDLFMRKSKEHFEFEDIAKKLAGGKKNNYSYVGDKNPKAYIFNYKMATTVTGCPVTACFKNVFGNDWVGEICSLYLKAGSKSVEEIINDVWHAIFSFVDDDKLYDWVKTNLQLSDEQAKVFVGIKIKQDYASLSLNAINKILPYLRLGYRYDEAVFMANLPAVVPAHLWNDNSVREGIINRVLAVLRDNPDNKEKSIADELRDYCNCDELRFERLYHPSKVDVYKDALPDENGIMQLGSPRTSSVRNPMAMRTLFRLRVLVNYLLRERKIDKNTKINIEFARGLNDANMRSAIEQYQREIEANRRKDIEEIQKLYFEEYGKEVVPTDDEILKYQLWKEQGHKCLYTGEEIGVKDFVGGDPLYDIEHTIPRSRGGDNSQMNKTLCNLKFNRAVKRGFLPFELSNHEEIMVRIEELGWVEKIEQLDKRINAKIKESRSATTKEAKDRAIKMKHYLRMQRDYWAGKLARFTMRDVPEGFSNRQGVDIGIIGRYARMYLNTVFEKIYVVKGATTADFRKMWGLQAEYSKKERVNHVHHCIDAITIACIDADAYAMWAQYKKQAEYHELMGAEKPIAKKPWSTFTEDVKAVVEELLVSHHTPDNMQKLSKKKLRIRGKVQNNVNGEPIYLQGDTARASLHKQTFYGVIKRDDETRYVVRKSLSLLTKDDVGKIVDDAVRQCVEDAIKREGFKEAISKPICFNEGKSVYIKKVRIYADSVTQPIKLKRHRDISRHEHKRFYCVVNDGNYCMAIYEGVDDKGKRVRSFNILNNLTAVKHVNSKTADKHMVPLSDENDYPLKCILRTGTMVLFYEKSPAELYACTKTELVKRLYKVIGMEKDGKITFKYHQEARNDDAIKNDYERENGIPAPKNLTKGYSSYDVNSPTPKLRLSKNNFNIYVEGFDFELTVTGEIKFNH